MKTEIISRINELKVLDKGFSVFGSSRHRYELNPTMTLEEIEQLEADYEISLSDEYKVVLQCIGNGGAGPGLGLEKLSLEKICPQYVGAKHLLRKYADTTVTEQERVDTDEISGYIKLFDYGCGTEHCLIVNGEEVGELIYFDCDGRFQQLGDSSILKMYESWLDHNLTMLKRIEQQLRDIPLQEIIDSEWEQKNFAIKHTILSLIGAPSLSQSEGYSGNQLNAHLDKAYQKWKNDA